jgi:membrane glycosyltransferase
MAKANLYTEAAARELPEIEDGLTVLVSDRRTRALHESLLLPAPLRPRGKPEIEPVMAEAKLSEAASLDEALRWLTPKERMAILSDPKLIAKLDTLAHPAAS